MLCGHILVQVETCGICLASMPLYQLSNVMS